MGKIGDLWVRLGLKKDEFTAGLDAAQKQSQTFGQKVGSVFKDMAAKAVALTAAFAAIGRGIADAIKNIAGFERANSELAAVLGTNIAGVKGLSDSAKELGRTSEFTAAEVTQLQVALARLGFDTGQIQNMQKSVLDFALAMGTDLGSAAEFTGSALRAFGLQSTDTKYLLDVLSASTTNSALNFSKLQTSISTVAPIAKSFGLDVKETTAFLGVLANNGFDASSAATALRNILLNLADANGKLAKGIGHSARTFPEIIQAFEELREKGVAVDQILEMTDKRSAAAAAALIAMGGDVATLKGKLDEANGSLEKMADTMADNLIGQVNSLKSAWEGLTLEFGNSTGPMSKVLGKLRDLVNALRDYQHSAATGAASHGDIKNTEDLRKRFRDIEKQFGTEEMQRQFLEWGKDAEAAYDRATDTFLAHRTGKNKRAMNKAGKDALALADIRSDIMGYSPAYPTPELPPETPTTPGGGGNGGGMTEEELEKLRKKQKQAYNELQKAAREAADEITAVREADEAMAEQAADDYAKFREMKGLDLASPLGDMQEVYDAVLLDTMRFEDVTETLNSLLDEQADKLTRLNKEWGEYGEKTQEVNDIIRSGLLSAIEDGLIGAFNELADVIAGVTDGGMEQVLKALVEPLAEMAIKTGTLVMMSGLAIDKLLNALRFSGNPLGAVAAGAALVAVGVAAKAGLAAIGNHGNSGTGISSVSSSASPYGGATGVQSAELVVRVEGEVKGSSIILSGQNTLKEWNK